MSLLKERLEGRIQKLASVPTWEEAVRIAAKPLQDAGNITDAYVEAMIANINRLGSYMVLTPGMAMPHARPEEGCTRGGLSLLVLDAPVLFPGDEEIWFVLVLGAESSQTHIATIESIADFLDNEPLFHSVRDAKTAEDIANIIP